MAEILWKCLRINVELSNVDIALPVGIFVQLATLIALPCQLVKCSGWQNKVNIKLPTEKS